MTSGRSIAGSLQGIIVMAVQQYTLIPREQWGVKIETHCPYVFFYIFLLQQKKFTRMWIQTVDEQNRTASRVNSNQIEDQSHHDRIT
mgnify:CR=1 FL=1